MINKTNLFERDINKILFNYEINLHCFTLSNVRTLSQKNRVYKCTTNVLYALNIYICTYVKDERCTENKSSKLTQTNMCLHRQRDNANSSQQMST